MFLVLESAVSSLLTPVEAPNARTPRESKRREAAQTRHANIPFVITDRDDCKVDDSNFNVVWLVARR
jgi:hypothetical protein